LISINNQVDRFNELPLPKKGASIPPEWTDAEREIFLKMEMESFKQVMNNLWHSLEKSRKYAEPTWADMLSIILKYMNNLDIKFKNDKAYFDDINPIKNQIMNLLKKLPNPTV